MHMVLLTENARREHARGTCVGGRAAAAVLRTDKQLAHKMSSTFSLGVPPLGRSVDRSREYMSYVLAYGFCLRNNQVLR